MSFDTLGLHPTLLRSVSDLGYTKATPIQEQAIPFALEGRDVMACAMTGSGKTAGFALPTIQRLMDGPKRRTRALVLSPTRELAAQIHEQFVALGKGTGIRAAAVFGGVGMKPQEQAFRDGVEVIIATPGRLLDHLQYPYAKLDGVEILVLDEADRMLDMGFLPDIRRVLKHVPAKRQTLFFSATMPAPIVTLSRDMLQSPATVDLQRQAKPAVGITQAVYPVIEELKAHLFLELLKRNEVGNVIVFCRTKHRSNRLAEFLEKHGVPNARIHGNRSQTARTDALAGFKAGRYRVLVATDIVARGIDVEALEHVVNFDVPHVPEDYIHRVGRTARADAIGDAYTFVAPEEERDLKAIERAIGKQLNRIVVEGFDYRAKPQERFEVPIAERIAEIRKRKSEERARAKEKADRKLQREGGAPAGGRAPSSGGGRPGPRADGPRSSQSEPRREMAGAGGGGDQRRRGGRGNGGGGGRGNGGGGGGQRG
ncbi:DEAD/DEAH box helicase [Longimicrobium terrae]|uniref:DEAD-box ATP-dependent RNA helicase RhpA n=1 Tax=Longimicrobium terrae TaxID=1639882 RepID=A0A841H367_9BACT|nr:DEAD/DEAH box helicase [Longimicrobium terrae]MBB4638390.1 ATP-dependent RNA helicase RhlE [Longimicrobium terrae]MBB6072541.1 ATP-dependent RNA helicase RhlE [Longimicrobium terrae]NNC28678.1 DEAD/DEAH box helicase [Longimicrobium terrae]